MQSVAARVEAEAGNPPRPTTALAGPMATSNAFPMERSASAIDMSSPGLGQRKLDAMAPRSRRDQPGHQSHSSRAHRDEQKTVGEYALHVLFTSVCDMTATLCRETIPC